MSTGRYSKRGWACRGFAFRTWGLAGAGETATEADPTDGWRAGQFNRVAVAPATNRTVIAPELSRVVWANPQGK